MENIFDNIKHVDEANQEYWMAREFFSNPGELDWYSVVQKKWITESLSDTRQRIPFRF